MQIVKDRYSLSMLTGSILIIVGFSIWWYAQSVVLGLDQLVKSSTIQEDIWYYSGALQWWRLQQTSVLHPLGMISISIGIFLIGNAFFWLVRRVAVDLKKRVGE